MGILGDEVAVNSSSMRTLALQLSSGDRSTSSGPFIQNGKLQDIGADTTKKLYSTDIEFKGPGGLENLEKTHNASMVDVEPHPSNDPPFTANS